MLMVLPLIVGVGLGFLGARFGSPPVFARPFIVLGAVATVQMMMTQLVANQFGFDRAGFRVAAFGFRPPGFRLPTAIRSSLVRPAADG